MFLQPKLLIKTIFWFLSFLLVAGLIYLLVINVQASQYSPSRVVQRFASLIENPTQAVTDAEKQELQQITQSGFFSQWQVESNIRALRKFAQQNPIEVTPVEFTGTSRRYAIAYLNFENDFKNPESKQAKIYLEQYGNWYTTGYRWRIYQIDMPKEDSPINNILDQANNTSNDIQNGAQNLWDRVRDWFGGNSE